MKTIKPVELTEESFTSFGKFFDLHGALTQGEGEWQAYLLNETLIDVPLKLGITAVKHGNFISAKMERHVLSKEILLCADSDMVLTVADSVPEGAPRSEDVSCFYMRKGQIVVLNKGIWHHANRGVDRDVLYYFLTEDLTGREISESEIKRETQWVAVVPEPVFVCVDGQSIL